LISRARNAEKVLLNEGVKGMRMMNVIRKYGGIAFAFMALIVAQAASTQFSLIYYQDSVPDKVKALSK